MLAHLTRVTESALVPVNTSSTSAEDYAFDARVGAAPQPRIVIRERPDPHLTDPKSLLLVVEKDATIASFLGALHILERSGFRTTISTSRVAEPTDEGQ